MSAALIAFIASSLLRDRRGLDLSITNQAQQEVGSTVYDRREVPAAVSR